MGVLIKKLNKIQVSGNFWPAVYIKYIHEKMTQEILKTLRDHLSFDCNQIFTRFLFHHTSSNEGVQFKKYISGHPNDEQ